VTVPIGPTPVPAVVSEIAAGRPVAAVWVNELGGVTFAVDGGSEYVKVAPPRWVHHVVAEADRLGWAGSYVRVPRVLGTGEGWLHTAGLAGRSAVDPRWVAEPATAARAIGAGLRLLHDALPVPDCPFDWSVPARLSELTREARRGLTAPPPIDRLVVCHGDACAPNTLIGDDGRCCGHVDLGDLGVADRWADLAVAMLSLSWNYPAGWAGTWEHDLLDAYGVAADPTRIDYYQRLWQAGDISSR
jgi:kanamycin kinase